MADTIPISLLIDNSDLVPKHSGGKRVLPRTQIGIPIRVEPQSGDWIPRKVVQAFKAQAGPLLKLWFRAAEETATDKASRGIGSYCVLPTSTYVEYQERVGAFPNLFSALRDVISSMTESGAILELINRDFRGVSTSKINPFSSHEWDEYVAYSVIRLFTSHEFRKNNQTLYADYAKGRKTLQDALTSYVKLDDDDYHGARLAFINQLGVALENHITLDIPARIEVAFESARRIETLKNVVQIYDAIGWLAVFIFQLFPVGAGIRLLNTAIQFFLGYAQFVHELGKAEKDGIVTRDEEIGAWFALAGIFLPAAGEFHHFASLRGLKALEITSRIIELMPIGFALLAMILAAMIKVIATLQRMLSAEKLGASSYAEFDTRYTVFIPLEDS